MSISNHELPYVSEPPELETVLCFEDSLDKRICTAMHIYFTSAVAVKAEHVQMIHTDMVSRA